MSEKVESSLSQSENDFASFSGSALLVVVGQPFTKEHEDLILEQIRKGLQQWDTEAVGYDINDGLRSIAAEAPSGEEGENGEITIKCNHEDVLLTVLINPTALSLKENLRDTLVTTTRHKHVIYAGHAFQGTGAWILQDDSFTVNNFIQLLYEPMVDSAIRKQSGGSLTIACPVEGDWKMSNINKHEAAKFIKIGVNSEEKIPIVDASGIVQFTAYLSYFVKVKSAHDVLQSSSVFGNIRFTRPTIYIFPGCQGDSALFGINGFNLLVDGGYQQKACFWDFVRHLDKIDAILLTHLNGDNIFGINNALRRKIEENVHPGIGHVYFNASEKVLKHSASGDSSENGESSKQSTLLVNTVEEGNHLVENLHHLGLPAHPCSRSLTNGNHPVNLYHKVGHGTLDMFVLNPVQDCKEMKEFFQQWNKKVTCFTSHNQIPLPNMLSVCALLVWKPANAMDKITRILFPGAAPQSKIFEGLDKIKTFDFLKRPQCCDNDLHAKVAPKKMATSKATKHSTPTTQVVVHEKSEKSKPAQKTERSAVTNKKSGTVAKDKKLEIKKDRNERSNTPSPPVRSPIPTPIHSVTPVRDSPEKSPVVAEKPPLIDAFIDETPRTAADEAPTPPVTSPEPPAAYGDSVINSDLLVDVEERKDDMLLADDNSSLATEPFAANFPADDSSLQATTTEFPDSVNLLTDADTSCKVEEIPAEDITAGTNASGIQQTVETPEAWPAEQPPAETHDTTSPEALPDPQQFDPTTFEPAPIIPDHNECKIEEGTVNEKDVDTAQGIVDASSVIPSPQIVFAECTENEATEPDEQTIIEAESDLDASQALAEAENVPHANVQNIEFPDDQPVEESEECNLDEKDIDTAQQMVDTAPNVMLGSELDTTECTESEALQLDQQTIEYKENVTTEYVDCAPPIEMSDHQFAGDATTDEPVSESITNENMLESVCDDAVVLDNTPPEFHSISGEQQSEPVTECDMPQEPVMESSDQIVSNPNLDQMKVSLYDANIVVSEEDCVPTERPESSDGFDDLSSLRVEPSQSEPELDLIDTEGVDDTEAYDADMQNQPEDVDNFMGLDEPQVEVPLSFDQTELEKQEEDVQDLPESDQPTSTAVDDILSSSEYKVEPIDDLSETCIGNVVSDTQTISEDLLQPSLAAAGSVASQEEGFRNGTNPADLISSQVNTAEDKPPVDVSGNLTTEHADESDDPFLSVSSKQVPPESVSELKTNVNNGAGSNEEFDPLRDWGQPLGLPAPPPPDDPKPEKKAEKGAAAAKKTTKTTTSTTKKTTTSKVLDKSRVETSKKSPSPAKSTASKPRPTTAPGAAKSVRDKNGTVENAKKVTDVKKSTRPRPATAPVKPTEKMEAKQSAVSRVATSRPAVKKTASASSARANITRSAPATPVTPCYVDLSYVPYHANCKYSDIDFFRRVRARYYVVSSLHPSAAILNNLIEAKQTWEDKELEVTVIPTYDTDTLRHWMGLHRDQLALLKIDIAPSASRCTVQLQDHETSCSAYRLEF